MLSRYFPSKNISWYNFSIHYFSILRNYGQYYRKFFCRAFWSYLKQSINSNFLELYCLVRYYYECFEINRFRSFRGKKFRQRNWFIFWSSSHFIFNRKYKHNEIQKWQLFQSRLEKRQNKKLKIIRATKINNTKY
ncbi:hypothetical protein IMG5_149110 [Ichthyophthirius multifiliis]|uniref:Uncharacterized protein n=1 Tax=Ichthyophthirius multifiliis TaxID=5932 RepID=G0QYF1_ICHMU|nr:hypothetical protein IMG5_149110 [Ichthyophthirius multifiliis]EGR29760.1 hypothetical protein IMG5_149110 [Ichthyophthirius multifiliis]|eukprot:XP_004030996.1 hypothetical protein IMG5_149110 [Ichthyophthirius multifiliis]